MNFSYHTSICVTILASVLFVGCSGNSETAHAAVATTNEVSTSNDQVAKDEEKKTNHSMLQDFPSDIFVADGAESKEVKKSGGKDNLILKYPESGNEDLLKIYLNGMSDHGWTQVSSSELPIGTITNFTKDSRKCTISIGPPKNELIMVAIVY